MLIQKYEPKSAQSYIQLKHDFANFELEDVSKDPDKWIPLLGSYKTQTNKVKIPGKTDMSKVDLIIHILASLPEKYEVAVST